ncbi:hypothetical protein [Pseudozobellia sp. WGM2]|uniref:hypothetical protein n=1 Tax=Pseudozobellia sp. WGM2 TaxID=2787625 RepID=UPI001AE0C64D|nr:hypothetical protein [Pseudozobellia sp. WGM2]
MFWLFLSMVFISNTAPIDKMLLVDNYVEIGSYNFNSEDISADSIEGCAVFKSMPPAYNANQKYSSTELIFKPSDNSHGVRLVLTKVDKEKGNWVGSYEVSQEALGIYTKEGVFGFVDINELGELPFYTEKGAVEIIRMNGSQVYGLIDFSLRNFKGKIINVSGHFIAKKENIID